MKTRLSALLLVSRLVAATALAAPRYEIVPLGLTGAEHTRNDGYKSSNSQELNEAGQARGYSKRYNGGSTDLGATAWLYDGTTTLDIGLTDAEHTRNDGYKSSSGSDMNEAGQVRGRSERYNGGSTYLGESVWLYDGTTTLDIGLTGAEHTRSDGYKFSDGYDVNEAGQVRGYSKRYNGGSTDLGATAWLYDGTTTLDIGLTDAEHTRSDGYKSSFTKQLNEVGQADGNSYRFNGSTDLGRSAWLYDGTTTLDIGLTDAEHTRNDGFRYSDAYTLNEAGQVRGSSSRYNGGNTLLGASAWLYNGTTTIDIGLTGAEHTRNDGYKYSDASQLNQAGQVRGSSDRYNRGSKNLGRSVWLYDGTTTIDIGLTGAEHTRIDGYKFSSASRLNEAGQVNGNSERYNGGGAKLGESAWLYNGTTTLDIGLTGAEHTSNDGYKYSVASRLNEAGQVSGYSYRFNGGSMHLGQDAWFYDPVLAQTFPLRLSTRSDGYSFSNIYYLGEDGLALGIYSLYDAMDTNLGFRAFYFTVADGLHDLGSLVDGGLLANGWEFLDNVLRANSRGQIVGYGKLTSQSSGQMAYLLTPVPEPSALLLGVIACCGLFSRRRK